MRSRSKIVNINGHHSIDAILSLIRVAISKESIPLLHATVNWHDIFRISLDQAVACVVFDGLLKMNDNISSISCNEPDGAYVFDWLQLPDLKALKYEWLGLCVSAEQEYEQYVRAINHLSFFYNTHFSPLAKESPFKMMILKGYGLSLNYPIPSHRPVGDIDTYFFGRWSEADRMINSMMGISISSQHEHHTIFSFEGFTVENHYDIINTKDSRFSKAIDAELKLLANKAIPHFICQRKDAIVYLPSADFNAVFLMRHLGQHMAGDRIVLRQVLDWALFIDKHSNEIDWKFISSYWQTIGISRFARCINTICSEKFGIEKEKFCGEMSADKNLCDRLFNDIICPEFKAELPKHSMLGKIGFKAYRFFANGWKRKLVYKGGLFKLFVMGSIAKFKNYIN